MTQYQEIFKRYEKKYLLKEEQYQQLSIFLEDKMKADQYGVHTIGNIYFDTPDYELIRTSLEKPVYKEKLRLRSYGMPGAEDMVFLEIKKKFKGIVYKRRVAMKLSQAKQYFLHGRCPEKWNQIGAEIDWVLQRYDLSPAVYIAYDRLAMYGKEDPCLRVTFDRNIRFRKENLDLSQGSFGTFILEPEMVLMEVKIPGSMPLWMSHLFSREQIFPVSFSKYGMCYRDYLSVDKSEKGGEHCA